MRRDYKALLLAILTFACITSGLLLFGTIDATQEDTPACEQQFKRECSPRKGAPKPGLICPSPRQPCPLDTAYSRDNDKLEQEGILDE
ncbi:MAG: hypothetical protein OXM61_03100 [Candidatus Poribacteria bacterium]|nr:hypothetical protein [Candidatus Poribacteria bacterium]